MADIYLQQKYKENTIIVRTATYNDINNLVQWWNNGEIMAHAGFPNGVNTNYEKVKANIDKINNDYQLFIIELNNIKVGEMNYKLLGNNTSEFGIKICEKEYQNKGFGTIILNMLFDYLFYQIKCEKIICDTNLTNKRAIYFYTEKMKMRQVKIKENCFTDQLGNLQSAVFFEINKKDYTHKDKTD